MTEERIAQLKDDLFENKREISLERALLYTESYKTTEGEPTIIRRAKATANILDRVKLSIRPGEYAGNRTIKPRSGIISPEMDPYWILEELDTMESRPQDPFFISEEDKIVYREILFPYWKGRSLKDFINKKLVQENVELVEKEILSLNQTDKGQGHIIADFEKLVTYGLNSCVEEVTLKSSGDPSNNFYKAALILLEASRRHILRYADLAEKEAIVEENSQRITELKAIAEVSRKISSSKPETFHEACQLLWYMCTILQYESNASSLSLGGFDKYMYPFYAEDLKRGMSLNESRGYSDCSVD